MLQYPENNEINNDSYFTVRQSVYENLNTTETFSLYDMMMCTFPIGNVTLDHISGAGHLISATQWF